MEKMLDRVQLSNFGREEARLGTLELPTPTEETLKIWEKNREQVQELQHQRQQRLAAIEKELRYLHNNDQTKPDNTAQRGKQDLRSLVKRLQAQIEQDQTRLQELDRYLAWGRGEGPMPQPSTIASLDLTYEVLLTEMKTAQEVLPNESGEIDYEPVLRTEGEKQVIHQQHNTGLIIIRLAKALLTLFFGLHAFLIALGNLVDYETSIGALKHTLNMDTIYPESKLKSRAITSPRLHHTTFHFIIFWELLIGILCAKGGFDLLRNLKADAQTFHESKRFGIGGLLAGVSLFFVGFQTIAGQWFGLWQSNSLWKALTATSRFSLFLVGSLIFISMKNDD